MDGVILRGSLKALKGCLNQGGPESAHFRNPLLSESLLSESLSSESLPFEPRGPKDQKNSRCRSGLKISSENEIFERATHRGPIFCGEIETSRLKFSSEIKNFDRDQKFRSGSNFFDRWVCLGEGPSVGFPYLRNPCFWNPCLRNPWLRNPWFRHSHRNFSRIQAPH